MSAFENKIESVRKAYSEGFYEPALALALTLPDICAEIEYPNVKKVGERYIRWCNTHIFFENPSNNKGNFSGAALYQLRCRFLHNGNSDLFKNTGNANARVIISKFELMLPKGESSNPGELLMRLATWKDDKTNEEYYTIKMNIRNIIDEIYYAVLEFYENWPTKNDFEDHSIRFLNYEETLKETY